MLLRTAYSVLAALFRAARVVVDRAARVSVACVLASALGLIVALTPAPADAQAQAAIATVKPASPPAALTGTLFTTREQRERLDRARSRGGMAEDDAEADTEPSRSVINGFVKRSDGRNTVWIDDIMKRDPRVEVAEQLEPNMVGGGAGGAIRLAASSTNMRPIVVSKTGSKRLYATARKRHKAKTLPKSIFKK